MSRVTQQPYPQQGDVSTATAGEDDPIDVGRIILNPNWRRDEASREKVVRPGDRDPSSEL